MICNQSVVMLVFRERLSVAEEMRAWECWYSRQHSYKQRVLDIGLFVKHLKFLL